MLCQNLLFIPFTIHELVDRTARIFPQKIFLSDEKITLTYSQFTEIGRKLAFNLSAVKLGVGERLLIACTNNVLVPLYLYATSLLGGILVPITSSIKGRRLSFVLKDCSPKIIITNDKDFAKRCQKKEQGSVIFHEDLEYFINSIHKNPVIDPNNAVIDLDIALLIYTSGSTGYPKAVALCHSNVISATESISRYLKITPDDKIINFNPFNFDYGLYQIFLTAIRGASLFIRQNFVFKEDIYALIENKKITGIPFVPSQIVSMYLRNSIKNRVFSSVRFITSTGSQFPHKYLDRLKLNFPNAEVYAMYGLTECKRVSYLKPYKLSEKPLSVGRAMPNVRIRIVDNELNEVKVVGEVGQLVVEGRNIMKGYWNNPSETQRVLKHNQYLDNTVLLTGDYFYFDEEKNLFFKGRKDDIIKSGDLRISTKDIENILVDHQKISEVTVIPIKDEMLENVFYAFVVLKPNQQSSESEIRSYITDQVESPYMIPKKIIICDKLPKTQSGKIDYKFLKKTLRKSRNV